jgi:hypothetical protein
MTAEQERKVFQQYGFGEIDLNEACQMTELDEDQFLRSYDLWVSGRRTAGVFW